MEKLLAYCREGKDAAEKDARYAEVHAFVNHQNSKKECAVLLASNKRNVPVLRAILKLETEEGVDGRIVVDPNLQDEQGDTGLIGASSYGFIQCVDLLLSVDETGLGPPVKNSKIVERINPNLANKHGTTALIGAAKMGRLETVEKLVLAKYDDKFKIDLKQKDGTKKSARQKAMGGGYKEVVELLKKHKG